jgi:hypothetical protein
VRAARDDPATIGFFKFFMMSARTIRLVAVIIVIVVAAGALLGWDLVYEQTLNDRFVIKSSLSCF